MKIEFAPGCFDHFDGTQEELDEMIAMIQKAIESGEIFENSRELTEEEFDELPEEIQAQIADSLVNLDQETTKRTLQ